MKTWVEVCQEIRRIWGASTVEGPHARHRAVKQGGARLWALLVAAAMVLSIGLVSVPSAHADDTMVADPDTSGTWSDSMNPSGSTFTTGRVWTDKTVSASDGGITVSGNEINGGTTVKPSQQGDFTVGLSALSSAQKLTGEVSSSAPTDIVLVLDVSGSMDYTMDGHSCLFECSASRLKALKSSVNLFLDQVAQHNRELPKASVRVSLVKFAGDETNAVGNDREGGLFGENYTQVVSDFTDNVESLKNVIRKLKASGGTQSDYGLHQARRVIDGDGDLVGVRKDARKSVIFFTDGDPSSSSSFDAEVANGAISQAHLLKNEDVSVYIGCVF